MEGAASQGTAGMEQEHGSIPQSRYNRDNREYRFTQAFDPSSNNDSRTADFKSLCKVYESLSTKELKTWWDLKTLQKYVDNNMIPRGLRLYKSSTTDYPEPFQSEWEDILNRASFDLMRLIIKYEVAKISKLNNEIDTIKQNLATFQHEESYVENMNRIDDLIEKMECAIIETKKIKYQRDTKDYEDNLVYNWRIQTRSRSQSRNRSRARSVNFNSVANPIQIRGNPDTAGAQAAPLPKNDRSTRSNVDLPGNGPEEGGANAEVTNIKRKPRRYPSRRNRNNQ